MTEFDPLVLRPVQPADTDAVIALVTACYADYGFEIELDTLDADLVDLAAHFPPPHTFQVLVDGEQIVGSVAVKLELEDHARSQLKRLFLLADYRGRGLGKKMTQWAFQWARQAGAERMHFWSDTKFLEAHALYRHLGCEDTKTVRELGGVNETKEFYFRVELSAVS